MAATTPQDRTPAAHRLARAARLAALLALCLLPTDAAVRADGGPGWTAVPALAGDAGGGRARDALPLVAAALAFVLLRGWRRERSSDSFG